LRILHYLNQFFAGKGAEEAANLPFDIIEGPVGPGIPLNNLLGDSFNIEYTMTAGDNWASENITEFENNIREQIKELKPDLIIAGPAFNAGRYGITSGLVCEISNSMGIKSVTSMFSENPGVLSYRKNVLILNSSEDVKGMKDALELLSNLSKKLLNNETLGPAHEEGYFPRFIRREGNRYASASIRAGDMLIKRIKEEKWETELTLEDVSQISPAPPITNIKSANLALITSGGLVPKGNPEKQVRANSGKWWKYSIEGIKTLEASEWESIHRGFFVGITNENPNYVLPLDVLRNFESQGIISDIHNNAISVSGVGTHVSDSKEIGKDMAKYLKSQNIDCAILVAT